MGAYYATPELTPEHEYGSADDDDRAPSSPQASVDAAPDEFQSRCCILLPPLSEDAECGP
ncbi:unnamed protein product, partial [Ixodes persulcatus]